MSTEQLTPDQSLKIYKIRASATGGSVSADEADGFIAGYREALNEVEHKTKQLQEENEKLVYSNSVLGESWHRLNEENKRLREERDRAVDILKQFVRGDIKDLLLPSEKRLINNFLDQLNQQNEG